ncbi:MAG: TonB-dependent receptor [Cytophagales bacterium]
MKYLFFFFQLSIIANTFAQLQGFVMDESTKEPLIGAVVLLTKEGDIKSTLSGLDGSFVFNKLEAGEYDLEITYASYFDLEQKITITGEKLKMQFMLKELTNELQEVTITTTNDGSSDENARLMEKKADMVMNVVSAKAIELSPDLTVANVVQRVSGISIERNSNGDGQHAIVRGMDKRYNYTTVNGVKIPSPDNKYRYVPLDIFPSDLLQRLEVYKSLTPSMEGDAVGGVVNMEMKDAPRDFTVSSNLALGYNQLFLDNKFMSYDKKAVNRYSPYELNEERYNATVNDFSTKVVNYNSKAPMPNTIGGISAGGRFLKKRIGVIGALSYQNTFRGSESEFFDFSMVDTDDVPTLTKARKRRYFEQQVRAGAHIKLDYNFWKTNTLKFYLAYISLKNYQTRDTKTLEMSFGYNPTTGEANLAYNTRSRTTEQIILTPTLIGEHKISSRFKAKWMAVYGDAINRQPENTIISFLGKRENFNDRKTFVNEMTRRWERNRDQDLSFFTHFYYNSILFGNKSELSSGTLYRKKDRFNFFNSYRFVPRNPNDLHGIDYNNNDEIAWSLVNPRGAVATALAYESYENTLAGYIQEKLEFNKLHLIGGFRYEQTKQGYLLTYDEDEGSAVYNDLLPSLQAKFMPNKKTNVRASYFKSVNRPGFFEIVPYLIVNEDLQERGNPELKRARIDNFDLRYELFPKPSEQLLVGVFYKNIVDPIEYTIQIDERRGQDQFLGPGNFGVARNLGFEIDFMKYFRTFGIKTNYTYTNSSITTQKSKRIQDANGNFVMTQVNQTRPLYGQADHVANVAFIYKSPKGIDVQLAFNYTGKRINTVSQFENVDLWQAPVLLADFSAEYKISKKWMVFAKANNLLNSPMIVYVNGQNPKNNNVPDQEMNISASQKFIDRLLGFNSNNKTLIQKDFYGASYLIGVRFLFTKN